MKTHARHRIRLNKGVVIVNDNKNLLVLKMLLSNGSKTLAAHQHI